MQIVSPSITEPKKDERVFVSAARLPEGERPASTHVKPLALKVDPKAWEARPNAILERSKR